MQVRGGEECQEMRIEYGETGKARVVVAQSTQAMRNELIRTRHYYDYIPLTGHTHKYARGKKVHLYF